jgi:murein DD-endopeptidase MepM/ murein hydrolase activator NlpD
VRGSIVRRCAVIGLAVGLIIALSPTEVLARGDSYSELQQRIDQTRRRIAAERKREKALLRELRSTDQRRMALERSLNAVTDQLVLATRRLDILQLQADAAAAELALKNTQLEGALADLEAYRTRLHDRAANLYMRGPETYSSVLFGASDFHQYVAGLAYAESVLNVDVDVVEQITQLKENIELQRSAVEDRRNALQQQTSEIAAEQARLAAIRRQQANARNAVLGEISYKERLLRHVRNKKEAYAAALQSMLEQSRSIEALLHNAQKGQRVVQGYGGYLKWPVSGRITSPYGWRIHPIYGYRSFHTGIDIGAPAGTTVKAARRGEVLYVGYRDAYGLIVIIDHGNSLATVYAHLSRTYVRAGQAVGTLASIAAVGCTGWCTGPHLHFEVRVNGAPQNPMNWL